MAVILWSTMVIVGALFALLTHEAAHAVAAKLKGAKILEFRPWPAIRNDQFYFGYVNTKWPGKVHRSFHIAPLYKNLILFPIFLGLAFLWLPMLAIAAWLVIDSVWWFSGAERGPKFDAWKYYNYK